MSKSETKELKVKSFRVDENTFSKFKEIASNEFGNQSQCLDALINLYETEEAKSAIVGRGLEIETFQDYLNKISRLFITSLQLSTDAEERAKESFVRKIESKDEALSLLKEKYDIIKLEISKEKQNNKALKQKVDELTKNVDELEKGKSTLSQLANRNYDLSVKFEEELTKYKNKCEKYESFAMKNKELLEESKKDQDAISKLKEELKIYKENLESTAKKSTSLEAELKEKNNEIVSYKSLIDGVRRESKAEIASISAKMKEDYKLALKEREDILKRGFELDKKELELEIKSLKLDLK